MVLFPLPTITHQGKRAQNTKDRGTLDKKVVEGAGSRTKVLKVLISYTKRKQAGMSGNA